MINRLRIHSSFTIIFLVTALLVVTGCDVVPLHMRQQPRFDPLEESQFFANQMASRPLPANVMPRGEWGQIKMNPAYYTGKTAEGEFVQTLPIEVNREVLLQGQEQFDIFCAPCHGRTGEGNGMIVQRGFRAPPSFHIDRLRNETDGYFFDVMTNGFGVMYSYSSRIEPEDRWAIVGYVRALQFSQNVPLDSLPEAEQQQIEAQLN